MRIVFKYFLITHKKDRSRNAINKLCSLFITVQRNLFEFEEEEKQPTREEKITKIKKKKKKRTAMRSWNEYKSFYERI